MIAPASSPSRPSHVSAVANRYETPNASARLSPYFFAMLSLAKRSRRPNPTSFAA
jgi:hypothetical protein